LKPITPILSGAATGEGPRLRSARWALVSLSLSMLLSSLASSIANVGLPDLAQAFDASFRGVQWVLLAYLLATTTLIVSVGRLGDMVGRRRMLLAGLALFASASALCGLAPSLWLLVAGRAAQGLGASVMMALSMAFVGETVAKNKTGGAMGLLGTMSAMGTALGPSLGGVLIAAFGWRAIFLAAVPPAILALWLAYSHLPPDRERPNSNKARFDAPGMLLLALTLAAYALAMTMGRGSFGPVNLALLTAAGLGLGLFGLVERRSSSPLIDLVTIADPALRASLAMSALVSTVVMATLVVGPFYLSRSLGIDAALAGIVLSIGPLAAAMTAVPAGRLADRVGAHRMTAAGLAAMTAGCALLALLPRALGVAGYVVPIVVITAGYALFQTANNTAVMSGIGQDRRGVISGLLNLSRSLGLLTGASAMGAVFASGSGAPDIAAAGSDAVALGMRATFAAAGLLTAAALALAIAGHRRPMAPGDGP